MENVARGWRASCRRWRAPGRITDHVRGAGLASRRKPRARQSRARFSTGGAVRGALGIAGGEWLREECAPETALTLLLPLNVYIKE